MSSQLRLDTQYKMNTSFLKLLRYFVSDRHELFYAKENPEHFYQNSLGFFADMVMPNILKVLLKKETYSGWTTWSDPSLPLLEFAIQLLHVFVRF